MDDRWNSQLKKFNFDNILSRKIQELQGIASLIIFDGKLDDIELNFLDNWVYTNIEYLNAYPLDELKNIFQDINFQYCVSDNIRNRLFELLSNIATFIEKNPVVEGIFTDNPLIIFKDHKFLFTGTLAFCTREKAIAIVKEKGGISVEYSHCNEDVNYLVVGSLGNESFKYGNFGRKIEYAINHNKKSTSKIKIIRERDFVRAAINKSPSKALFNLNDFHFKSFCWPLSLVHSDSISSSCFDIGTIFYDKPADGRWGDDINLLNYHIQVKSTAHSIAENSDDISSYDFSYNWDSIITIELKKYKIKHTEILTISQGRLIFTLMTGNIDYLYSSQPVNIPYFLKYNFKLNTLRAHKKIEKQIGDNIYYKIKNHIYNNYKLSNTITFALAIDFAKQEHRVRLLDLIHNLNLHFEIDIVRESFSLIFGLQEIIYPSIELVIILISSSDNDGVLEILKTVLGSSNTKNKKFNIDLYGIFIAENTMDKHINYPIGIL